MRERIRAEARCEKLLGVICRCLCVCVWDRLQSACTDSDDDDADNVVCHRPGVTDNDDADDNDTDDAFRCK